VPVQSRSKRPVRPSQADDGGDTRARLLQAAGQVFAESGYYGATIRKISALAGVNVALVNYHFRDKLGLYVEVLQESVRASHVEAVRGALDLAGPPEEIFRAVIRARLGSMTSVELPDRHVRILIHELAQPTPALSRVINESLRPVYNRMRVLVAFITGGPPDGEKARLCAHSVMGQILVYALASPVLTRLWPELKMTPDQLNRIADHIAEFSLAYLNELRAGKKRTLKAQPAEKRK
jgi:AcrR family transcriptional regulator